MRKKKGKEKKENAGDLFLELGRGVSEGIASGGNTFLTPISFGARKERIRGR